MTTTHNVKGRIKISCIIKTLQISTDVVNKYQENNMDRNERKIWKVLMTNEKKKTLNNMDFLAISTQILSENQEKKSKKNK